MNDKTFAILLEIIKASNTKKNSVEFYLAKLLEEAGEFSQAAMTRAGLLPTKKVKYKDHVFEEACDAIIMILGTLGKVFRKDLESGKITEDELIKKVLKQIPLKIKKWKHVER